MIPSDHKWVRNLLVSLIVVETLEGLKMRSPEPRVEIDEIRRKYHTAATEELAQEHNRDLTYETTRDR